MIFFVLFSLLVLIPIVLGSANALEIKLGQTAQVGELEINFYDVKDSRCLLDVTCVWEGEASAMINVKNQTHKIGETVSPGVSITYITPYNITLVDVKPHPISTEKPDYVAVLDISKNAESSPKVKTPTPEMFRGSLQTGETIPSSFVIIIIETLGAILIVLFIVLYAIKKRKGDKK